MLSSIEAILAKWTGRTRWPHVQARLEERMSNEPIPNTLDRPIEYLDNEMTDDIYSYEVDGKIYAAALLEVAGRGATSQQIGHQFRVQYDPANPKHIYYAPACVLASRFVGISAVLIAAIAIAYSVYIHTR